MDWPLSFELKPGFSDCVSKLFSDLIADLAPDAISKFLHLHDRTVDGTNQFVISADLDADALDAKLRAALRTAGFELPDRRSAHIESSHDCCGDDMIGPGAVGVKSTASDLEDRTKRLFGGEA